LPSNYAYSTTPVDDGDWHQLVGVYNAGAVHQIYVDGAFEGSALSSPIFTIAADFLIGGIVVGGVDTGHFNGLISDVRVYDNALSASDVEAICQQVLSGQAVPEPSSLALVAIAGTCLLAFGRLRRGPR